MEENEEKKTRADFDTDSEWYTYQITHPEEFEEKKDEENEKKYPLLIVMCQKCGTIIDESNLNPVPDETIPYDKRIKCPKCNSRKFKALKKEEALKLAEKQKQIEKKKKQKDLRYVKSTIKDIEEELKELKTKLDEWLKNGNITPERYVALYINLSANICKYYRYDDRISTCFALFRKYAYGISDNVLRRYYSVQELEDTKEMILMQYNEVKEFDMIYLQKSLEYSKKAEIVGNSSDIEVDKAEIENDLARLQSKIENQEKYNEKVKELEKIEEKRRDEIDDKFFFKELRRINGL